MYDEQRSMVANLDSLPLSGIFDKRADVAAAVAVPRGCLAVRADFVKS